MNVLGIGNALVDILARIESDVLLEELGFPRGCMKLVDKNFSNEVLTKISGFPKVQSSGGSAANTIHGLARLGIKTGFVGKTGNDELGRFFIKDLQDSGIQSHICYSETETGRAIAMISPDGERTFATYLGAAVELDAPDLSENTFSTYQMIHVEGYLVQNHNLLSAIGNFAQKYHLKYSLDLASFNIVEENLDFLRDYVAKYVDILFANEEEAKAFTGKTRKEALETMSHMVSTAVVKLGKDGSMVLHKGEYAEVGVIDASLLDTTGAGDLYAAGFLYGMINGFSPKDSAWCGAVLSGHVIQNLGAKISEEQWNRISLMIKK